MTIGSVGFGRFLDFRPDPKPKPNFEKYSAEFQAILSSIIINNRYLAIFIETKPFKKDRSFHRQFQLSLNIDN